MSDWSYVLEGYDASRERLREALCTLGNGYVATRGALPEVHAGDHHYPGTYLAGVFNRLATEVDGHTVDNESLVNQPNWLLTRVRAADGDWLGPDDTEGVEHRVELDVRRAMLARHTCFVDQAGRRTTVTQRRLVSMADPHLVALETTVRPENWSGSLVVRSGLDGRVRNTGVPRYRDLASDHLDLVEATTLDDGLLRLVVATNQSHVRIAEVARTRVRSGTERSRETVVDERLLAQDLTCDAQQGEPVTVEKVVAIHHSRDRAISEPAEDATRSVRHADGFDALVEHHVVAWSHLWSWFDLVLDDGQLPVTVDAAPSTQLVLRLHQLHLLQTTSEHTHDLDVGVPARGLHGEAYRGHIFWDELFILPLLQYRMPTLTRSLLHYRHLRLNEARHRAREAGAQGALFPWQSSSSGREESQTWHLNPASGRWLRDNSHLQRHINVAIAYNVWKYVEVTGDLGYLRYHGAEMLVEIARGLASLATYDRVRDRYDICGVMGPDEFHDAYPDTDEPGLDDNAYMNVMTAWTLRRTLDLFDRLAPYHREEVRDTLRVTRDELDRFDAISTKLVVPFHGDGIISQFAGYEHLEELDWDGYRERYGDIQRLDRILEAEGDSVNRYKASKQADVLMLFYLLSAEELAEVFGRLGYTWDPALIPRNVEYYLARTSHGSTLSRVVHSWVLARLDRERSWTFFREALRADVADVQGGTTEEGIHLGAMAGTVDLVQRGYTGLEVRDGVLWLNPRLPDELRMLTFEVHFHDQRIRLEVDHERLVVTSRQAPVDPVSIGVGGQIHELPAGTTRTFPLRR